MAVLHGKNGVVKIGANTVAETRDFTIDPEADIAPKPAQGDTWESHNVGLSRWSGEITCWLDSADTTGQGAMTLGAEVAVELYPEGESSGLRKISGNVSISNTPIRSSVDDNVEITFNFVGNGAMTDELVTP